MDKKNKERFDQTEKYEAKYGRSIEKDYSSAYKGAKAEIVKFIMAYGTDNKLTNTMYQYDRYDKLIKAIMANVAGIKTTNPQEVNSYLKDQYLFNYYQTGYILETNYQSKLGIRELKRSAINPLSITGEISLKQNKEIVRANINKAITQSIAQGEGIGDTSKRIKNVLERNMNDAMRIARTETTTAMNESNFEGMKRASKSINIQKQWVATLDTATRDRHRKIDGQIRDLDKPYSNGLMYPGDQSGEAAEVINCRCTQRELVEGYSNSADYRRARGVDGKNKVIPYTNYTDWAKNRL